MLSGEAKSSSLLLPAVVGSPAATAGAAGCDRVFFDAVTIALTDQAAFEGQAPASGAGAERLEIRP